MNVVLLYGGRSAEHEVSLVSAAGILPELARMPEMEVLLIGITRGGLWYRQDRSDQLDNARHKGALSIEANPESALVVVPGRGIALAGGSVLEADCVFPVLHGTYGEDGTIQGLLETAHLPYVGSGVTGSSVGMDKLRAKQLWERNGLPVVPYVAVRDNNPVLADEMIRARFGYPVFVKPNAAGSSIGISRVEDAPSLAAAIARALTVDGTVLIEKAFPIREIETSLLGNRAPRTFPPGEVIPRHQFYDYDAKYTDPEGARLVIPADLDAGTVGKIQEICAAAFEAVDAAGLARVDCFLNTDTGAVYLNEINTIPGFTPISMYPKMVEYGGVSYGDLLRELIRLALERSSERTRRDYHAR
ncbi:MAG: D-alanine--D-alanine ligase [Spirochaetaceae bacterium]|nr:MAG: D-alanine--D-alanine ligase [Spirochaetaceae bacterium]